MPAAKSSGLRGVLGNNDELIELLQVCCPFVIHFPAMGLDGRSDERFIPVEPAGADVYSVKIRVGIL